VPIDKLHFIRVAFFGIVGLATFPGCSAGAGSQAASDPAVRMVAVQSELDRALRRPDDWFKTDDGREFADILISWQNDNGGWFKKYDPTRRRPRELPPPDTHDGPPGDAEDVWRPTSTFDNGATYTELRILARAYGATGNDACRTSFLRGLNFILAAQYPNGGWPQRFPLQENYGRNITFNDNAMVNVMSLLRDVERGGPSFAFVPASERERCRQALARGIDCTLATQIRVGDKLTGWCQQHDAVTLAPTTGRSYELPAIAAAETAGIALFLMDLPSPDRRVAHAVESAVQWFGDARITGKRFVTVSGPQYENGRDRVLVDDPSAPPIWARLYDIRTNRPFFSSRDGVARDAISNISYERRNNYGWFGNWGTRVETAYADWKRRTEHTRGK
jgi:pectate lyase